MLNLPPRKNKSEPHIVKIFRKNYPDSIYLDIYDDCLKVEKKRKHADKKWLLKNMKTYHRLRTKKTTYSKKKVKGSLDYA